MATLPLMSVRGTAIGVDALREIAKEPVIMEID